jgi:hypothetical protein
MIDRETGSDGVAALSVAIACLLEDANEAATTVQPSRAAYGERADELRQTGLDVAALATAMQVLVRRAETSE